MKTTLDIPDDVFRAAKSQAALAGCALKDFVTEALRERLSAVERRSGAKPWMKGFGGLAHLRDENRRIEEVVDKEFEVIDPEGWA